MVEEVLETTTGRTEREEGEILLGKSRVGGWLMHWIEGRRLVLWHLPRSALARDSAIYCSEGPTTFGTFGIRSCQGSVLLRSLSRDLVCWHSLAFLAEADGGRGSTLPRGSP